MAFQNNFPATPQPIHPIKRRPQYQKFKPTVLTTKTNSSGRNSQSSNPELPEEDIYARHLESSGDWAKTPDGAAIYHWNGIFWSEVEDIDCVSSAYQWLRCNFPDQATCRKATSCFDTARLVLASLPEPPTQRCIIPCTDGWLELIDDQFQRVIPDRSIGITYAINVSIGDIPIGAAYPPKADFGSGYFSQFLQTSLPDKEVRFLIQQYAGYTLIPSAYLNLQVAMIFIGNGGDGKGVMTGLLRRLHSKTCAMNLNALDGFGAEGLIGATLALVDEGPTRGVIDDDRIKTMISGDSLDINRKHKPILTYKPMAKWIISANETPRFGSAGQAIERRFLFAPWTASLSVEQRIPNLEQKIFDLEAREVLDWVLQGALAVLMKMGFDKPDAAMRLKEESLESMDTVLGWKNLAQPVIVNCDTPKHLIYEDYREWCSMNGQVAVRSSTFWMRLLRHLGVSEAQVRGTKKLINQQRVLTVKMKIHQPDPSPQEDEKHPFDE